MGRQAAQARLELVESKARELVTQWRTTPCVVDWNKDGLNDLVMLDHEGYLAFFQREKRGEDLDPAAGPAYFQGGGFDNKQKPVKKSPTAFFV